MTRQRLLTEDRPPRFWAIVDEAALHRVVGGRAIMRGQLQALTEWAAMDNVTIQVIAFEAGAHPGMDSTFIFLEFDEKVSDVVYVEGLAGYLYLQKHADLQRYRRVLARLRNIALKPADSVERMMQVAHSL